jgi:hypothetical protein
VSHSILFSKFKKGKEVLLKNTVNQQKKKAYSSLTSEFDVFFYELKKDLEELKKKDLKKWDNLKNIQDVMTILRDKISNISLLNDPGFLKRITRRLIRENLLPKSFTGEKGLNASKELTKILKKKGRPEYEIEEILNQIKSLGKYSKK